MVKDGGYGVGESCGKYISDIVWDADGSGGVEGKGEFCCEDVECRMMMVKWND